jgi:hypothetical protein
LYTGKKEKELKKQQAPAVQKPKVQTGKLFDSFSPLVEVSWLGSKYENTLRVPPDGGGLLRKSPLAQGMWSSLEPGGKTPCNCSPRLQD